MVISYCFKLFTVHNLSPIYATPLGAIHKLRLQEEGGRWSKKSTFCKLSYHRKCKRRGVGGQKKPNFVYVVCECPLAYCYHLSASYWVYILKYLLCMQVKNLPLSQEQFQ